MSNLNVKSEPVTDQIQSRRVWTPGFDMSTIPQKVFASEHAKRNAALRKTKSGGIIWSEHREDYSRCRCMDCIAERNERNAARGPKKPPGRPRLEVTKYPRKKPYDGPPRPQGRPRKVGTEVVKKTLRPRGRPRKTLVEQNISSPPPASLDIAPTIDHDVTQSGLSKYSR